MASPRVPLGVETMGTVTVIRFPTGDLLKDSVIQDIHQQLAGLIEPLHRPQILLDMSGVRRLSSSLVGSIVRLNTQARGTGGRLALFGLPPQLTEVLRLTRLDKVLPSYRDECDALGGFPQSNLNGRA